MNRWWRDYDDGFDEISLHEGEEISLPFISKGRDIRRWQRPRFVASTKDIVWRDKLDDESRRQKIARVKAWGVPY